MADRTPAPRRRLVFVSVVPAILLLAVFGAFLVHDGTEQPSGITQTSPMPEVSLGSPTSTMVQSLQPKSNINSVISELPIAKAENFPGTQTHELADNARISRSSERRDNSREEDSERQTSRAPFHSKSLGRYESRQGTRIDRGRFEYWRRRAPRGSRNIATSGRSVKEPELLFSSAPIYPAMARQAHVEGQVTIEAVIDTTGKLTNMTVISGAPMLQQAALDSLRSWKFSLVI